MSIKATRLLSVQCDSCGAVHPSREATTYAARVKAGVNGWVYDPEEKRDDCKVCASRPND